SGGHLRRAGDSLRQIRPMTPGVGTSPQKAVAVDDPQRPARPHGGRDPYSPLVDRSEHLKDRRLSEAEPVALVGAIERPASVDAARHPGAAGKGAAGVLFPGAGPLFEVPDLRERVHDHERIVGGEGNVAAVVRSGRAVARDALPARAAPAVLIEV